MGICLVVAGSTSLCYYIGHLWQSSPFRLLLAFLLLTFHKLITDLPRLWPLPTGIFFFFFIQNLLSSSSDFSMGYEKPRDSKQEHRKLAFANRGDWVSVSLGPVPTWLTGISCKVSTAQVNIQQWLKINYLPCRVYHLIWCYQNKTITVL